MIVPGEFLFLRYIMAFTFTVEDGSIVYGPPASNSYVTVQYADDYLLQNHFVGPMWSSLSISDKQLLLAWATRYLDQRASWNGQTANSFLANPGNANVVGGFVIYPNAYEEFPVLPQQPLRWPRAGVFDIDGNPIPYNVIPIQLQNAVCEMARYLLVSDRSVERPQDGLNELKVDVITLTFKSDYILPIVPSEIGLMIRGLGTISSGYTNFAKIKKV